MAGPTYDPLTGLPNRETFLGHLARRLGDEDRDPLAVVVFDVADFTAVNDSRGHAAGDRILREVAVRLGGALRAGDLLARVGGDEFGVIYLGVSADEAGALARTAASAVASPVALEGLTVEVAVSTGIAHLAAGDPAPAPDELLAAAERAGH